MRRAWQSLRDAPVTQLERGNDRVSDDPRQVLMPRPQVHAQGSLDRPADRPFGRAGVRRGVGISHDSIGEQDENARPAYQGRALPCMGQSIAQKSVLVSIALSVVSGP
jgi:hypothetical protein